MIGDDVESVACVRDRCRITRRPVYGIWSKTANPSAFSGTKALAPRLQFNFSPGVAGQSTEIERGKIAMGMSSRTMRLGGKLLRRVTKPIPIVGTAVVLATAVPILRSKGLMRGGFDIALDAIPIVGSAKGIVELFTGDLIPDRAGRVK